jgi:hypothetical protein
MSIGFGGGKIHTCKNECVLYRGPKYKDLKKCPICGLDRFDCRKISGVDENYNRNRRKGEPKKGVLLLFYHSSFEALVCKQGVKTVAMAQRLILRALIMQ